MKMNKEKYEGLQFLFVVDKCTLHTYLVPITYAKKKGTPNSADYSSLLCCERLSLPVGDRVVFGHPRYLVHRYYVSG